MKAVSRTAYYTAGIRMEDAKEAKPIVGDRYAARFMDADGLAVLARFEGLDRPKASNLFRHRIIDEIVQRELDRDLGTMVVLIGAGFDSRAFRLRGGRWLEVDEPPLIEYKESQLPASEAPNPLTRLAVDFDRESLDERLAPHAMDGRVVVVVEGVFMYLEPRQIAAILRAIGQAFPRRLLVCDLMSRRFFEKYARPVHDVLAGQLGAPFRFTAEAERPEAFFLDHGLALREKISIVARVVAAGLPTAPPRVIFPFLRTLRQGYSVCVFEPA